MITIRVIGEPGSQGSKTQGRNGFYESSKKLKPWRSAVTAACDEAKNGAPPLDGPLAVGFEFRFKRPGSHFGTGKNADRLKEWAPHYHATKPDLSKVIRATEDAMVDAGLIRDDCRIARFDNPVKVYADPDDPWTGATITITTLDNGEKR